MKKIALILFLAIFTFPVFSQEGTSISLRLSGHFRVLGAGPRTEVSIFNTLPLYIKLISLDGIFAEVGPGTRIVDLKNPRFKRERIPVVGLVYSDSKYQNIIGICGDVLNLSRSIPALWAINTFYYADGRKYKNGSMPPQETHTSGYFDLPEPIFSDDFRLFFVNGSEYRVVLNVDGVESELSSFGDIQTFKYSVDGNWTPSKTYTVTLMNREGFLCKTFTGKFSVSAGRSGPGAIIFLVTPTNVKSL
jgi:hypothetical protein